MTINSKTNTKARGRQLEQRAGAAQAEHIVLRQHGDGQIGSEALEINRVADGQVVETWNYQDMLSLMGQLGVIENPFAPPS